ncbi:MAG: pilus (MSHA type) biogenesis protein MshL [Magnetococcus sp. YQC-5]
MNINHKHALGKKITGCLLLCMMAWSGGCTSVERRNPTETPLNTMLDTMKQEEKAALTHPSKTKSSVKAPSSKDKKSLPTAVQSALLPYQETRSAAPGVPAEERNEPTLDISVEKVSPGPFFNALTEKSKYNIVIHPDVTGEISLHMNAVTVPKIIDAACKVYGFRCEKDGNQYFIFPATMQTMQFNVNYLPMRRVGTTHTKVSGGQTTNSNTTQAQTTGTAQTTNNNSGTTNAGSDLVTTQESNYWYELTYSLCNMLGLQVKTSFKNNSTTGTSSGSSSSTTSGTSSTGTNGVTDSVPDDSNILGCVENSSTNTQTTTNLSAAINLSGTAPKPGLLNDTMNLRRVVVTPQTGRIMIRAYYPELQDIKQFIENQKNSLERQVILEAKIIEVQLSDGYQSGINWSALQKVGGGTTTFGMLGGGSLMGMNSNPLFTNNTNPMISASSGTMDTFGGAFTLGARIDGFSSLIDLLETQGEVHVLSSPRVSTLNNQKAIIRVGQDEMFFTNLVPSIASFNNAGGTSTSQVIYTPTFSTFFSGIALDVTPQIDENGMIMLHIHPSVSEVSNDQKELTIGSTSNKYPMALNRVRETDSMVRAHDKEVVVIGGLMKNAWSDNDAGLPGLDGIPILGRLFSNQQKSWKKTELIILLRPIIADDPSVWRQQMQDSRDRLQKMQKQGKWERIEKWELPSSYEKKPSGTPKKDPITGVIKE